MSRLDTVAGRWPAENNAGLKTLLRKIPSKGSMLFTLTLLLAVFTFLPAYGQEEKVLFREEFNSLDNWRPLYFPKIKRHSSYTVIREKDGSFLKAESNASASGIIYGKEFNVYEYPKIRWRWKIENVYKKGDAEKKSGDDYPLRIYIIFKYDPEKASFGQRVRYGIAKKIYGEYPPQSSLNYLWANRQHAEKILTNPFVSEARMIVKETGEEKAGEWVTEGADIIGDYRKAFGISPPAQASIAIMNDSDNTGERSVSYIDFIEIYK